MRYLSVCSGIEAASVAWEPFGWQCAGLSEIEKFPRAVLEHRLLASPMLELGLDELAALRHLQQRDELSRRQYSRRLSSGGASPGLRSLDRPASGPGTPSEAAS